MSSIYLSNFSYLFVPFTTEKLENFPDFCKKITTEHGWAPVETENRYLHRYVADRISNHGDDRSFHFQLTQDHAECCGLHLGTQPYSTEPKDSGEEPATGYTFQISNVELYAFDTAIGILVFELRFPENDPFKIASAQYYLRKISTEKIHAVGLSENPSKESFVDISSRILEACSDGLDLDFFFYATPGNEKANFLTYIDVPKQNNYDKELFYLKWCYNGNFDYDGDDCDEDSVNYAATQCTIWGISAAAAVCLVHRSEQQQHFIETVFQKNFRNQYLLTYILLLHQKYMMYLFLTKLSIGLQGNLGQLRKYKEMLYHFETQYMFSNVSEIPQYQRFYSKVRNIFALNQLFSDVKEPLLQLAQMEKQQAESEQQKHDQRINTALTTLSLLTIVSALADASGITANLGWLISPQLSKIIQSVSLIGVIVFSAIVFYRLIFPKKR